MPGQLVSEADIPVGPLAQRKTVDPDFAVGHHAVELHEHAAPRGIGGQHKVLAVPTHPAGRNAPAPPAGAFSSKGPSMPQSCGRLTVRQAESPNPGCSAPTASAFRKRQPASNGTVLRGAAASGIAARRNTVSGNIVFPSLFMLNPMIDPQRAPRQTLSCPHPAVLSGKTALGAKPCPAAGWRVYRETHPFRQPATVPHPQTPLWAKIRVCHPLSPSSIPATRFYKPFNASTATA